MSIFTLPIDFQSIRVYIADFAVSYFYDNLLNGGRITYSPFLFAFPVSLSDFLTLQKMKIIGLQ